MLSGGTITQRELIGKIGEWSNPAALARALGEGWTGGYFGSGEDALAAAESGPMGAALRVGTNAGHMVVTSPSEKVGSLSRIRGMVGPLMRWAVSGSSSTWKGERSDESAVDKSAARQQWRCSRGP